MKIGELYRSNRFTITWDDVRPGSNLDYAYIKNRDIVLCLSVEDRYYTFLTKDGVCQRVSEKLTKFLAVL